MLLVTGPGDLTYNSQRQILGVIPLTGKISYHLFMLDYEGSQKGYSAKLCRKSKWHPQATLNKSSMLFIENSLINLCRKELDLWS